MSGNYLDAEGVRETLLDLGDEMDRLGFPGVLESVEGNGKVGNALRRIRDPRSMKIIVEYLKNVAKDIKALKQKEGDMPHIRQAMVEVEDAWTRLKKCVA